MTNKLSSKGHEWTLHDPRQPLVSGPSTWSTSPCRSAARKHQHWRQWPTGTNTKKLFAVNVFWCRISHTDNFATFMTMFKFIKHHKSYTIWFFWRTTKTYLILVPGGWKPTRVSSARIRDLPHVPLVPLASWCPLPRSLSCPGSTPSWASARENTVGQQQARREGEEWFKCFS